MKNILFLLTIAFAGIMFSGCKKSKCKDVSCYNGGTCDESTGLCACVGGFTGASCGTPPATDTTPYLILKFKFDSTQIRLDNFGNPAPMAAGHAGQSPNFKGLSQHYVELAKDDYTQLGAGAVLYHAPETTVGGSTAIDFSQSVVVKNDSVFLKVPLKSIPAGSYKWLRVSLAYQNYEVRFLLDTTVSGFAINQEFPCNIASFVGFNTYISNYKLNSQSVTVNGNKKQGYWGAESYGSVSGFPFDQVNTGDAPGTTVVNPNPNSPIPAGSCVETAKFEPGLLTITGTETKSITVNVSLSINKSFEWVEVVNDGKWEPAKGEYVVDMGLRGIKPVIQ